MDKVKEAVQRTAEAAKAREQAVQNQILEMEDTIRIVINTQGLIDNGTFVGRVRSVLSESWGWLEQSRVAFQKQVDLLKMVPPAPEVKEGGANGKDKSETESPKTKGPAIVPDPSSS